ncbi:MAG: RecX family transcriptional regulator [Clostridia bacterium]|nr:RecX family transcriptional regulator [Clostridia bacterium]
MAPRYRDPDDFDIPETDGGEAGLRPLKSRRLVDMMEPSQKGKGRGKVEAEASVCPEGTAPASSAPGEMAPRQTGKGSAGAEQFAPVQAPPEPSLPKQALSKKKASPKTTAKAPTEQPAPDLPPDTCAVLSVTPAGEGETVTVVLALPDPEGKQARRVRFHLLVEQYAELKVQTGTVTPAYVDALLDAGRLCGAIRRGMALLQYGDQSARRLAYKLTAKGIDRETATRATAYLAEKGYIREDDTATLRAEQGIRKGWGERRIREDLIAHGFTREAVEEAMESLADTDWEETCAEAIRKKYGEIPEDRGERQKLMAAMMRLGYDADTVREAMRRILRKQ